MMRRVLSLALCALLLSTLTLTALAEETAQDEENAALLTEQSEDLPAESGTEKDPSGDQDGGIGGWAARWTR